MGRVKYLAKNIGLLTIGQFGTRILSFFLVPLYTNILTTSEYGSYDLFNVTIGLLVPILTLNICEGVLRFALDSERNINDLFSVGCKYLFIANVVIIFFLLLNRIFSVVVIINDYSAAFFGLFFVHSISGVMTSYVRGIDKIADLSISGVICSASIIGLNILFLCVLRLGLTGYFYANIIGPLFQIGFLAIRTKCWKNIKFKIYDLHVEKEMLGYCIPLIANSVAWWVNSVSDRYVIVFFCGMAANGIYAVASKIPSVLDTFQGIFNQAWTLSAVKEFDSEDKQGFFSHLYNSYNCLLVLCGSILIVLDRALARILFAKEFYEAWKYAPFLLMAVLFGALSGYIGGFLAAVKNSKLYAKSTVAGALLNLVLNIIFVPLIGVLGAALATVVSYWLVYLLRVYSVRKYINLRLQLKRDCIAYILLVVQGVLLLLMPGNPGILYMIECVLLCIEMALFREEMRFALKKLLLALL